MVTCPETLIISSSMVFNAKLTRIIIIIIIIII